MRRALRQPLAVVFAVLVVSAGALGSVVLVDDDVRTLDDASDQFIQKGDALAGVVAVGVVGLAVGAAVYSQYASDTNTEDLQKADALETKKAIYDQASIQKENNDLVQTAYGNYLNDTQSIALMEGKNAYIRALENGSTESVARNRATEAVADYYAVKQQNLAASWNVTATVWNSSRTTAANTTDVGAGFVTFSTNNGLGEWGSKSQDDGVIYEGMQTADLQLVNATSETVLAPEFWMRDSGNSNTELAHPQNQPSHNPHGGDRDVKTLAVRAPTSNYETLTLVEFQSVISQWDRIETQNTEVQGKLDAFVNNTYDSYQQGEINTSDLVDPYLGAREYSPETSDTWNLRTLASMGLNSPQNLSSIGVMNITTDGQTYSGVLMTDESPAGGFVVNQTYNTTQLNGSQFIAELDGGTLELEGTFTITSAETTEGEAYADGESIEYRDVSYETANTEEFQALQQQLDELTAEINARQQNLRNSGGVGWLPDFGGVGLGTAAPVLVLAGGALVLLNRS